MTYPLFKPQSHCEITAEVVVFLERNPSIIGQQNIGDYPLCPKGENRQGFLENRNTDHDICLSVGSFLF